MPIYSFSSSRFLLVVLGLVVISTVLIAQSPSNEQNKNHSKYLSTFDVKQVSFLEWENDSPSREFAQSPDNGKLVLTQDDETGNVIGPTAFQVSEDRIIYLNSSAGIVVIDIKTGKTINKFSVYPYASNFDYENGKYYVNTIEHSVDIYDNSGHLIESFPYERKYNGSIVRYNNSTYIITAKETVDYEFDGFNSVEVERGNEKVNNILDGSIDGNGNLITTLINGKFDLGSDHLNDPEIVYTFILKTPAGKIFKKEIHSKAKSGYHDIYMINGISNDRAFITKVQLVSDDPTISKTLLQTYSFNSDEGFGREILSEIEIPFSAHPYLTYGDFSPFISSDGVVYQLAANDRGAFMFALKEVRANEPHSNFPEVLVAPDKK